MLNDTCIMLHDICILNLFSVNKTVSVHKTLFSIKATNIYPSFIADDARIMAKRPVVLK